MLSLTWCRDKVTDRQSCGLQAALLRLRGPPPIAMTSNGVLTRPCVCELRLTHHNNRIRGGTVCNKLYTAEIWLLQLTKGDMSQAEKPSDMLRAPHMSLIKHSNNFLLHRGVDLDAVPPPKYIYFHHNM